MNEARFWQIFFEVHSGLYREGPGDDETTTRAWQMMADLPAEPTVVNLGCGPGAQSITLAKLGAGRVLSVDTHPPFLDDLRKRACKEKVGDVIVTDEADMGQLLVPPGSVDIVWAEGSIYNIGYEFGLKLWRQALKPGGYIAVSEPVWLKPDPPEDVWEVWKDEYPAIADPETKASQMEACGYELIGQFILPERDWWNYYTQMDARLAQLRERYKGDPEALELVAVHDKEVNDYRRFADWYSYGFFIGRKPR